MPPDEKLRRTSGWIANLVALLGLTLFATADGEGAALVWLHSGPPQATAVAALSLAFGGMALRLLRADRFSKSGAGIAALALVLALAAPWRQLPIHAALTLAAVAAALISLRQTRHPTGVPLSAWLASLAIGSASAALAVPALRPAAGSAHLLPVPPVIAVGLVLLGVGILLARPEDRFVHTVLSPGAAGMLARRFLFGAAIMPVLLVAGFLILQRNQLISITDGAGVLTLGVILSGLAVALFSTAAAASIQDNREEAEKARLLLTARLQEQAEQLQETVSRRTQELSEANASLRAAAESNALLALVAHNTSSGVMITDAEGRLEWTNAAFTRMTGYELAEVKGRKPGEFLRGSGTDLATIEQLRNAFLHGEPCKLEILNYTKRGTPFWQTLDLQPVRDRAGKVLHFVASQTDITAQRAATERLEHVNQRLALATQSAALGVWEWDARADHSYWDERTIAMYGLDPAAYKGTREEWRARLHPEDRARAVATAQALTTSGDHYEQEFRIIRAHDGAVRHLLSRAIVQRNAEGKLLRLIGTQRDVTAEREATQQMATLNERLRLALRSSHYGVWEIDVSTGRHHWDSRVFEIYGLPSEHIGASATEWQRVLHPADRAAAWEKVQQVIAGRVPGYDDEYRVVRPDGAVRHIEAHGHLQCDASGGAARLVGLIRDVSAAKELERALAIAEQRWQLAIEGSNDSVWDWDVSTGEVYHDSRWAPMLGFDAGEVPETIAGWKALAHPDDLAANEAAIAEHFAQRSPYYRHELRMRAKTGEWRWILDRGKVVSRAPDGRPLRMAGTHSDITARKELEERLEKTEQLAREVGRLAQIGGWEIDLATSRVTWDESTRRIHEVDADFQLTLESMLQFFPSDALGMVEAALNNATPAAPSFDIETPLMTAAGRRIWVRMLGHGDFRHGKAIAVRGAIQDITSRHESEEARRELETQLFQAQKMETLGTLAGGIAHDFNNLLTGIIGYHELAADSVPEDHPARSCLNEARNASLRARELVEQILTFGRQSGSVPHGPLDLGLVVEEARRFLRATLPANITIEVYSDPNCGSVLGDATQLHQVILNLGSNAGHAMRHHGGVLRIAVEAAEVTPDLALTLSGTPASSYVRLSVRDTGHGMDESTRRRIFDPFFTTKKTREGTGLGLAVVHGIVRSHHGAIDVESSPGSGSTFHIYLPTAGDESTISEINDEIAPRGSGEFVAVVDDEEIVGSCTKLVLESRGYRTLIFGSAEQCLAEMEGNPNSCAVLVTDQTMPGMQGTELAAAMRKSTPGLPVVIMSGYFSKIPPQALDELGQVELLAKPFTTDELAHAVYRALHPNEAGR